MLWMAAASMLTSAIAAKNQKDEQTAAALNNYTSSLKSVTSQNEAIDAANTANTIRTAYKVALQQLQTGRLKQQAVQEGFDKSAQGAAAMGVNAANAAASGTVGASVNAAADDIAKKQDEAQIGVDVAFNTMLENAQIGVEQTVMAGQDAIRSSVKYDETMPGSATSSSVTTGLLAAAGQGLNLYAQNSISLGKGTNIQQTSSSSGYAANSVLGGISGIYSSIFK